MKAWAKHLIRTGVMLVVVLLFFKWINLSPSAGHILEASLPWVLAGCAVILVNNILKGIRFAFITRAIHAPVPYLRSILVNNISIIVGRVTPGRIGEASKIALLGQKTSELSFSFTLEKLLDFFLVLVIALVGLNQFSDYRNSTIIFALGLIVLVLLVVKIDKVLAFVAKRPVLEDRWFVNHLGKISPSWWVLIILSSLIIRAGPLALAIIVDRALGLSSSLVAIAVLYNLAIILGQISAIPGGYGVREAGYTFLISTHLGLDIATAGIAATLITLIDLFIETSGALVGWIVFKSLPRTHHEIGKHT